MEQVSSNLTLFYRIFIPVFFTVFVGAMVIFMWLHPQPYYASIRGDYLRIGLTASFVTILALLFFTLWRLRRVEVNEEWVYVTDYFRQARYPWTNVESVRESSILGLFKTVTVYFNAPGSFGPRATFVTSRSRWQIFKDEHEGLLRPYLR